jgi:antirestriction protein ArdC
VPSKDFISMPAFGSFKGAAHFYATTFHELGHYAAFRIMPRGRRERRAVASGAESTSA